MKKLTLFICIILLCSCNNKPKVDNIEKTPSITVNANNTLEGAWKLVSFINYGETGIADTILTSDTNKQIKMYSKTKVMWSRTRIFDTIDWFAYGEYKIENGILTEILEYGSKSMNEVIKEKTEFSFNITISENEFSQTEIDDLGHPIISENYIRLE
ncbi:hypothetical protein AAFN75_11530 [Algibacter sp. AS12]|uniref:hypothetical protein n=1 Tax=Algibacter sp. AS12 TaxID=3135773 RepID=UPI00398AE99C